jgi:hypothetical protein
MSKGNRKMPPDTPIGPRHGHFREIHFGALSCPDHNFDARTADTSGMDILSAF